MTSAIPFRERISCTIPEGCKATGLGRTKLYEKIAEGQIRTCKIGTRTLLIVDSLIKLIDPGSANSAEPTPGGPDSGAA
jgi:hypothetical protein